MRRIKNKRDAVENVVIEPFLQYEITLFRKVRPALGEVFHLGIIINVEMLGLQHVPLELRVLDFIPPEEEKLCRGGGDEEKEKKEISEASEHHHIVLSFTY
jgi:hypothetical protein